VHSAVYLVRLSRAGHRCLPPPLHLNCVNTKSNAIQLAWLSSLGKKPTPLERHLVIDGHCQLASVRLLQHDELDHLFHLVMLATGTWCFFPPLGPAFTSWALVSATTSFNIYCRPVLTSWAIVIDSSHRFFRSSRRSPSLRHGIVAAPASGNTPVKGIGRRDSGIHSSKPFLYRARVLPCSLGAKDHLLWSEKNLRVGRHMQSSGLSFIIEDHNIALTSTVGLPASAAIVIHLSFYKLRSRRPPPSQQHRLNFHSWAYGFHSLSRS